jgi:tetrahydromethanopterin S-methyltransferase subunit G
MTQKEEFSEALKILEEIEENVGICCAITMEPDEVLLLIDRLKEILNKYKDE